MTGITESMSIGAQALNSYSVGMAVTAHNVANVNTSGYMPQVAVFADGPQGEGVQLETIFQGNGLARPRPLDMPDSLIPPADINAQTVDNSVSTAVCLSGRLSSLSPSGTDLGTEMTNMIVTQYSYTANAATIRASDEMLGTLLNIMA
ncbi:MAG: flagellar basal-body rod protein [Desulfovibrio sp.]|jgi:flagellar basal-body rod protein FlgC|nr:flagellar basal-body rod protein [Desulfovibrio sp.]